MRREVATKQRTSDAGKAEHRTENSLVAAAISRRDDVSDNGLGGDDEPPAAKALHRAEENKLGHVLTQSAQRRPNEEQNDRRMQNDFRPIQIAQLDVNTRDSRQHELGTSGQLV